jgi:hypothetical protein
MYLIIILHIHHTCMSISIYVGLSHHSFFLLYTVLSNDTLRHLNTFYIFVISPDDGRNFRPKHVACIINKWMIEHLCCCIGLTATGDIQMLTVCLLQSQSPVHIVSASYTPNLYPVLTYHFLRSKSNSCTHISLPTLQIYLLYSHITFFTPNVLPTRTCFHPNLGMAVYSWLFETGISLRVFLTEILSTFCLPIRSTLPAQSSLLLVTIVANLSDQ